MTEAIGKRFFFPSRLVFTVADLPNKKTDSDGLYGNYNFVSDRDR